MSEDKHKERLGDSDPSPFPESAANIAAAVFMADLEARSQKRLRVENNVAEELTAQERLLFRVMIATAACAPVLTLVGFGLIVFANSVTVGTLSAVVGLLNGAGSLGLRRLQLSAREDRHAVEAADREDTIFSQAFGVALLIPDADLRARAMSELSSARTDSIRREGRTAKPSRNAGKRPPLKD
jgi:hypothetical protein